MRFFSDCRQGYFHHGLFRIPNILNGMAWLVGFLLPWTGGQADFEDFEVWLNCIESG